jgi:hypothetical protein
MTSEVSSGELTLGGRTAGRRLEVCDMPVSSRMVASDILMSCFKKVPIFGAVVEVLDAVRLRYDLVGLADRLAAAEMRISRFEQRQRDLVAEEMRTILGNMSRPGLGGEALTEEIRSLLQIRSQGWEPTLFEGLFRNSSHWQELRRQPQHYGRILDSNESMRPDGIYIVVDTDRPRFLELTPFAFSQLLSMQSVGVPKARVLSAQDIWAFPKGKLLRSSNLLWPFSLFRSAKNKPEIETASYLGIGDDDFELDALVEGEAEAVDDDFFELTEEGGDA